MYRRFIKRVLDIVFSLLAIILLALPMLIIAIVIKCDSKGPAIFKAERTGKNCKPFKFYKFRSMRIDAPRDCATRLLNLEEHTTKVGAFLRKTSLDELPQLFCILKGDMSFVGPRPVVFTEEEFIEARKKYGGDKVTPGLTGLAQVNGRNDLDFDLDKKARYDGEYAKKITFWKDLKILCKTVVVVFKGEGLAKGKKARKRKTDSQSTDGNEKVE